MNTKNLTILYGSETGNSEMLAFDCEALAKKMGFAPQVFEMDEVMPEDMPSFQHLLIITSTYGDGDMPENAEMLWQSMSDDNAPHLENTAFSVLALGDSDFDEFCKAGKSWDKRLEELGAKRIYKRVDCDIDFDDDAEQWMNEVLPLMLQQGDDGEGVHDTQKESSEELVQKPAKASVSVTTKQKENLLVARLVEKKVLTLPQSSKETIHYELDFGKDIHYAVGDILNIYPKNNQVLIDDVLAVLGAEADDVVQWNNDTVALEELFTDKLDIRNPSLNFVKALAQRSGDEHLQSIIIQRTQREQLEEFLYGKDIVDLLEQYPDAEFSLQEFVELCKPLLARAYSIASSSMKYPQHIHLTVGSVRYQLTGGIDRVDSSERQHLGVCSTWLADELSVGDEVSCYLTTNKYFKLPTDTGCPIIMVGPGTGIAPFIGFLQERKLQGGVGDNWLFFGEREEQNDFIYRKELTEWQSSGILNKLSTAFSRDQADKVYVQHKMLEEGEELFNWLERGAYFYVCGDMKYMAKDVDKALHSIVARYGNLDAQGAKNYIEKLKDDKRYVRDIY